MTETPNELRGTRRRSIIPLLVVLAAGGLFLWGKSRDDQLTRAVAGAVEQAAVAVCDSAAMPSFLHWTVPEFKSTFIKAVKPACAGGDPALELSAVAAAGDRADRDGTATHVVTVVHGAVPLLQLRIHALEPNLITVIGWSKP